MSNACVATWMWIRAWMLCCLCTSCGLWVFVSVAAVGLREEETETEERSTKAAWRVHRGTEPWAGATVRTRIHRDHADGEGWRRSPCGGRPVTLDTWNSHWYSHPQRACTYKPASNCITRHKQMITHTHTWIDLWPHRESGIERRVACSESREVLTRHLETEMTCFCVETINNRRLVKKKNKDVFKKRDLTLLLL